MKGAVAPGTGQRPCALHPEVQVDLVSISHCAMNLNGGLCRKDCGIGGGDLGVADMNGCAGVAMLRGIGGTPDKRTGEFQLHRDTGKVMLDRLERADRLSELFAHLGIFGGEI